MKCQDINKIIYKYCDGQVSPKLSNRAALHLNSCPNCHNMYQLTQIENDILRELDDLPVLSPDFTSKVMKTLQSSDSLYAGKNSIRGTIISSPRSTRGVWLGSLAAVAAVIALCIFLPQQSFIINKFNLFNSSNLESSSTPIGTDQLSYGDVDGKTDLSGVSQSSEPQSVAQSASPNDNTTNKASVTPQVRSDTAIKQTASANVNTENNAASGLKITLLPSNIPDSLKFVQVNNDMENNTVYNYSSLDGKQSLQLTITPYNKPATELSAANDMTRQRALTISREIQSGDDKIIVVFSGNMSVEELTNLANTIQFQDTTKN